MRRINVLDCIRIVEIRSWLSGKKKNRPTLNTSTDLYGWRAYTNFGAFSGNSRFSLLGDYIIIYGSPGA